MNVRFQKYLINCKNTSAGEKGKNIYHKEIAASYCNKGYNLVSESYSKSS